MDVDGVLTDGKIYYLPLGDEHWETKGFDSHDGLAFHFMKDVGIESGFISGRKSHALDIRAANMFVKYVYQDNLQKESVYQKILSESALNEEQVAYIGDDFTDICLLKRVGLACAVANARQEARQYAHFITQAVGGQGALREVVELILKSQNQWQSILEKYGI